MQQTQHTMEYSIHLIEAVIAAEQERSHNFISFRNQQGSDKVLMYGLAQERKNSSLQFLRGIMAPPSEYKSLSLHFSKATDFMLFTGDEKTYHQKMAIATDALHFINAQNLNYRPEDTNGDNPNSITHSLIKAMDLEFPSLRHERILLPKNWRAAYV